MLGEEGRGAPQLVKSGLHSEGRLALILATSALTGACVSRRCANALIASIAVRMRRVLPGSACFAEGLARKKINLDHARMELRDLSEIHAERPHRFQRRVDDYFLLGSERWLQKFPPHSVLGKTQRKVSTMDAVECKCPILSAYRRSCCEYQETSDLVPFPINLNLPAEFFGCHSYVSLLCSKPQVFCRLNLFRICLRGVWAVG